MCRVYGGGWVGGGGEGGGGKAGGSSEPETKAAQRSAQWAYNMARAEVDVRGPLVPQCQLINAQQYPHRLSMAGVGRQKVVCKSRPGHLWLYQYCVWVVLECGYNVKQ